MTKLPFGDLYDKDMQEQQRWRVWQPYDPCPCGCGVTHQKLTKPLDPKLSKVQHSVGCKCKRHIGKRSQRKGQAAQAKMHRKLGGTGFTPSNEESARPYPIIVMPESKHGYKGSTVKFYDFIGTEFFRRALHQSERAVPAGSGAKAAVVIDDKWMVVKL